MKKLLPLLLLAVSLTAFAASPGKPNIIFILADDLGIPNLSCYGSDHEKSPNLDQLAQSGIRFTHAFTAALCGPSRALLLTGRYAFRTGATNQNATGEMKPEVEKMIPTFLKPAGYVTSCVGKWGQLPLGPAEFGFDDYFSFKGSGIYWTTKKGINYSDNGHESVLKPKEYMPDLMQAHVLKFINDHREQPFFLYYPMSHVHGEIVATPDSAPDSKDLYADNVAYMDKLVGQLIAELESLKLREKTLVLFMGDNGTGQNHSDHSTIGGQRLSGEKGSMREGGGLVPLIANWPGVVPAGKVLPDLIDGSDMLPTFLQLAGAQPPANKVDGQSFVSQLRGEKGQPRPWIFNQLANSWYVRESGYKLDQTGTLFDMSGAPFKEIPVPADTKDAAAIAARQRLQTALAQLNPAGGITDTGDGSGRSAKKSNRQRKPGEAGAPSL